MMSVDTPHVIVSFEIETGAGKVAENLHAIDMGDDLYCLDNSPFYAYGVSFCDIVLAPKVEGVRKFVRVARYQGHSTYRLRLPAGLGHESFLKHWAAIANLGCSFEGFGAHARRLYTIDVPPDVDLPAVYRELERGEENGWWNFEEAHYCDPASRHQSN
jgi:hypothetical protein